MAEALPLRTRGVLRVDSDWGSVILITNEALIERDPTHLYPSDVHFTGTQIFVGEQQSLRVEKKDVPFVVLFKGPPIDIATAHGDASSGSEPGNVVVNIGPVELVNTDNTGDGVNVKVFPKIPLIPN